jgi:tRNA A37 threonylcarbamoyladenosine modification protein TsaB
VETPRDTTPVKPPADMVALRATATRDLNAGIERFAQAVAARDVATVAGLFLADDARRRDKFVQYLKDAGPISTFQVTEAAQVTETAADAGFTLLFKWRADFGVEKKKSVKFQASTRRRGDEWAFAGVRLLENFP